MTKLATTKSGAADTFATPDQNPVISMLRRVMENPDLPIERIEQAFAFYKKVEADQAEKTFKAAFVKAQKEMEQVKAEATNPQTHSKYATFEALDAALRPIYSKHGFAFTHTTETTGNELEIRVVTFLMHEAGHERRYQIDMPTDGKGAKGNDVMTRTHATGSGNSYGKRYNIGNAWNVATYKDDDGNAAAGRARVATRSVKEELPAADSATKRDEILRDLRKIKAPMAPQDMEAFSTKWGGTIDGLRKADADQIRGEFKERMPQNGK